MTIKFSTLRNAKGFRIEMSSMLRHTYRGEPEFTATLFFARWGIKMHYGPRWAVGC